MKTVASHDSYSIAVDEGKNRMYLTMRGSWTNVKQVPHWLDDLSAAIKLCRRGYTQLIDWRQSPAILLTDHIADAHKLSMEAGLRKAARLYDRESFLKHQMDRLTEKTGYPVKSFFDQAEAEAWLNEP